MRVGLQTISWGDRIVDLDGLVKVAAGLGYQGLEFAQKPDALPPAHKLKSLLAEHNLCLAGLAGGDLGHRVEYASSLDSVYLYADEWDEHAVSLALERGFIVGLHPHRYKGIETIADTEPYLDRHPRLGLILDTAHQHLAADDIVSGLSRHASRVVAVHFKDWTRLYGTSPLRFARGFVALGQGELGDLLEQTLSALVKRAYEGWIMVEQDTPHGDPAAAARVSRQWLAERGL